MDLRKGTLFLILAWAVVLVTGYGLTLVLARLLTREALGDYGLVMSVLVWLEIVVINGLPVAVQ
jgi:O-antigen/teichoic acid export membrane protein